LHSLNIAKEVFEIESKEIANLSNLLTDDFEKAVHAVYNSKGKFIICGMGKSGLIGKKIAATLASTGTPSFFLHPVEAYHGDLGMIEKQDVVLLISNSGETDEVLKVIPFLKSQGNITISMSGNPYSTLAKNTTYHLNIAVQKEACPLQLAPTSSATATLVMGDALAVALMKLRDFKDKDFAQFHPGGSLGKRLLTTVENVMIKESLPLNKKEDKLIDVMHQMTSSGLGLSIICEAKKVVGLITDGDLRKAMESEQDKFFTLKASYIMTIEPKKIDKNIRLVEAQSIMEETQVNSLIVVDANNELLGIITYKNTI
jgi:arabinose-5-phosphate isomerase